MNKKDLNNQLRDAAGTGDVKRCKELLDAGANPTAPLKHQWNALEIAANNGRVEVCRLLVEHGASIKAGKDRRLTPMQLAVFNGQIEVVRYFLDELGEDIDQRTLAGRTLDQVAASDGEAKMVAFLATYRLSQRTQQAIQDALPAEDAATPISRARAFSPL